MIYQFQLFNTFRLYIKKDVVPTIHIADNDAAASKSTDNLTEAVLPAVHTQFQSPERSAGRSVYEKRRRQRILADIESDADQPIPSTPCSFDQRELMTQTRTGYTAKPIVHTLSHQVLFRSVLMISLQLSFFFKISILSYRY